MSGLEQVDQALQVRPVLLGGAQRPQTWYRQVDDARDRVARDELAYRPRLGHVHDFDVGPAATQLREEPRLALDLELREHDVLASVQKAPRRVQADEPHPARD